jgi:hypothetical protein
MSTVIILTPVIIAAWPAIAAAVTAAAAGMGLAVKEAVKESIHEGDSVKTTAVEVELEDSQILSQSLSRGKELVLTKDGIELKISRDERGSIKVCAEGLGRTKAELESTAEEFVRKMTQCYVYHRTVTELKNKKFQMVNEEVTEDGTIRIHVRRNED